MPGAIDVLSALSVGGDAPAFEFVDWRGDQAIGTRWSRTELAERAAHAARVLGEIGVPGDRIIVAAPPGPAFVAAFFGCLAAQRIAVPAKAPVGADSWRKLERLANACGARAIVARPDASTSGGATGGGLTVLSTERLLDGRAPPAWSSAPEDRIAYLQYTSGSTGAPRGVIVTFGALAANIAAMRACWGLGPSDVGAYWLPPHHDMGLVGGVLAPVALGFPSVLTHPSAFLQRPERWAVLIASRAATFSGGPDFAFDLLAERAHRLPAGTDLRAWRVAVNGAEPVRRRTLARVAAALAPFGFDPDALCPGYGLAEAVLFVTARAPGEPAAFGAEDEPVSCGRPHAGTTIAIVDPRTRRRCADGETGEIWVRGPRPLGPYWGEGATPSATFGARIAGETAPWLRTGDLGRVRDGALAVSGRLKDLLVRRGRKAHAADLEAAIRDALGAPVALRIAVFAAEGPPETGSSERIVAALETHARSAEALAEVTQAAFAALSALDFAPDEIVPLRPGAAPVTSSGKLAKGELRAAYAAGALEHVRLDRAPPPAPAVRRHVA